MTTPNRRLFALLLWLAGLIVATSGLFVGAAPPAMAATGDVFDIRLEGGNLRFILAAQDLPAGASIQTPSVQVSLQGTAVEPTVEAVNDAAERPNRRVVLTIDISGSMRQEGRLEAAKNAAEAFLGAVPDDVQVGLIAFNETVTRRVEPTTQHEQVRQAVAGLEAGGDTALYDAVVDSLSFLGYEGLRSLVLLSDGENDAPLSPTTIVEAESAVAAAAGNVDMTIVGIGTTPELDQQLQVLATAAGPGRGRVIPATDLEQVTESFQGVAETIAQQVLVTAPIPESIKSGEITLDASATISDGSIITVQRAFLLQVPASTAEPTAPPDYGPKPIALPSYPIGQEIMPVALVAIFAGAATILAIALLAAVRTDTAHGRISRRLSLYTLTGRQPKKQAETTSTSVFGSSAIARSAVELAGRVVAKPKVQSALAARLDIAGLPLKPAEWTLIQIGSGLSGGLLLLLLSGGSILATLLGLALGITGPQLYLVLQRSRREDAFLAQLPETLQLIAGSLSVGYSLSQAVDTVVREGSQPVSGEFNRALVQARLGMPVEDALETVATRFRSKDMAWAVMAIRIQREVGGNLAEVLSNVAGTLRERERLHRQVRVLSAEGRLSAWILGSLPVVFTLYLVLVRPEYLRPLYTTTMGWLFVIAGGFLFVAGVLWLRKVVKVQV